MRDGGKRPGIPLFEVVALAYRRVFGHLGLLLELGWLPLLIVLALSIVPDLILGGSADAAPGVTLLDLVEVSVALVCLTAFAVRWHQAMLFVPPGAPPRGLFPRAWGRFLLYTIIPYVILFGILATLILLGAGAGFEGTGNLGGAADVPSPAVAIAAGLLTVVILLLWLAAARLALLFPASAYGAGLSWRDAWRLMRGNTWRLLGCFALASMPFMLAVVVVLGSLISVAEIGADGTLIAEPGLGFLLLRGIVNTLANFILVALGATILSEFYRRIVLAGPGAAGPGRLRPGGVG